MPCGSGLGLDACAFDRDADKAVIGEKAELVCRQPFVAAPVCFFGDDEKKSKYRGAYFKEDEGDDSGFWYHGDLVETTGSTGSCGGVVIHGRSDTTLKPGGVRIGTAEVHTSRLLQLLPSAFCLKPPIIPAPRRCTVSPRRWRPSRTLSSSETRSRPASARATCASQRVKERRVG